jgi:hypothetical protein
MNAHQLLPSVEQHLQLNAAIRDIVTRAARSGHPLWEDMTVRSLRSAHPDVKMTDIELTRAITLAADSAGVSIKSVRAARSKPASPRRATYVSTQ